MNLFPNYEPIKPAVVLALSMQDSAQGFYESLRVLGMAPRSAASKVVETKTKLIKSPNDCWGDYWQEYEDTGKWTYLKGEWGGKPFEFYQDNSGSDCVKYGDNDQYMSHWTENCVFDGKRSRKTANAIIDSLIQIGELNYKPALA